MAYLMEGVDFMIMDVQDDDVGGGHYGYYEDYYDYYIYEFKGINSEDFYQFEGPGPLEERRTALINLGETFRNGCKKPNHLAIGNDLIGAANQCGGAIRRLDYLVHSTDHHVISTAKYFEDMTPTDSCFNQEVQTTKDCTRFSGGFEDVLQTGCNNGTSPPQIRIADLTLLIIGDGAMADLNQS